MGTWYEQMCVYLPLCDIGPIGLRIDFSNAPRMQLSNFSVAITSNVYITSLENTLLD